MTSNVKTSFETGDTSEIGLNARYAGYAAVACVLALLALAAPTPASAGVFTAPAHTTGASARS